MDLRSLTSSHQHFMSCLCGTTSSGSARMMQHPRTPCLNSCTSTWKLAQPHSSRLPFYASDAWCLPWALSAPLWINSRIVHFPHKTDERVWREKTCRNSFVKIQKAMMQERSKPVVDHLASSMQIHGHSLSLRAGNTSIPLQFRAVDTVFRGYQRWSGPRTVLAAPATEWVKFVAGFADLQ